MDPCTFSGLDWVELDGISEIVRIVSDHDVDWDSFSILLYFPTAFRS